MSDDRRKCFGNYNEDKYECTEMCDEVDDCQMATLGEDGGEEVKEEVVAKVLEAATENAIENIVDLKKAIDNKKEVVLEVEDEDELKELAARASEAGEKLKEEIKSGNVPLEDITIKPTDKIKKVLPTEKKPAKAVVIKAKKQTIADELIKDKELLKLVDACAKKIKGYTTQYANAFGDYVFSAAPVLAEAQALLSPKQFNGWCKSTINYDRTSALRTIQTWKAFRNNKELLTDLGPGKINALLPLENPVLFVQKHADEIKSMSVKELKESIKGDKPTENEDPSFERMCKLLRRPSSAIDGIYLEFKKCAKSEDKLNTVSKKALLNHRSQLQEIVDIITEVIGE